jgi:hypothetical protein
MIGDRVEAFETAHVVILPVRLEPSPAHGSFRSHRVDVADASTDEPESVDPSDVEVAPAGVPDAVAPMLGGVGFDYPIREPRSRRSEGADEVGKAAGIHHVVAGLGDGANAEVNGDLLGADGGRLAQVTIPQCGSSLDQGGVRVI